MDTIKNLIEYFKQISIEHKDIKGFITGEEYEANHSLHEYPLLWLKFPLNASTFQTQNGDTIELTLTLGCYSNFITDEFNNKIVLREGSISTISNQISYIGLVPQDILMNDTFRIINQVIGKISYDITNGDFQGQLISVSIETSERKYNDDLYGSEATIVLIVENPYSCNLQDVFNI